MAGTGDKLLTAAEIKEVTDTKVNISDVVNALNSTSTNKPLSAAQGKVLNDAKVDKTDTIAIEHGGTNATSASNARTNLDVYSKSEVDTAIAQSTAKVVVVTVNISDLTFGQRDNWYRANASMQSIFGRTDIVFVQTIAWNNTNMPIITQIDSEVNVQFIASNMPTSAGSVMVRGLII